MRLVSKRVVSSPFRGVIQAAVGSSSGFGAMPLKRMGRAAKATSSARARCARIASAVPSCIAAGVIKPMPLWRCSWLYKGPS